MFRESIWKIFWIFLGWCDCSFNVLVAVKWETSNSDKWGKYWMEEIGSGTPTPAAPRNTVNIDLHYTTALYVLLQRTYPEH